MLDFCVPTGVLGRSVGHFFQHDHCVGGAVNGEFHHLLHGAPSQCGYEEFIIPVFVINAIERAIVSGKEEMIGEVSI